MRFRLRLDSLEGRETPSSAFTYDVPLPDPVDPIPGPTQPGPTDPNPPRHPPGQPGVPQSDPVDPTPGSPPPR